MRDLRAALATAQQVNATPYIYLSIGGVDYSSRIISIEHIESPYREYATIRLDNHDRALDPGTVEDPGLDLRGKRFTIGYGYNTALGNMYLGDGTLAGYNPAMPYLWVKSQFVTSVEGKVVCEIYAEGMWAKLREIAAFITTANIKILTLSATGYTDCIATDIGKVVMDDGVTLGKLLTYSNTTRKWWFVSTTDVANGSAMTLASGTGAGTASADSTVIEGEAPYFEYNFGGTQTIAEIITLSLAEAGMTLNADIPDDGIITTHKPFFHYEPFSLPSLASIIGNDTETGLIQTTKCYLRSEAGNVFKLVYPQDTDSINQAYYSYQAPYFTQYTEKVNLTLPNDIKVYWGYDTADVDQNMANLENPGSATDPVSIAAYGNTTVREIHKAPTLTTVEDANKRASAILTRKKAESLSGRLVLPYHDCSVELYDKVRIYDTRGL